jgi:phosphoglycerate dehydrogenase-like enzyme
MIGALQFRAMRDGATFINTARGALVDEAALIAELATGRISAVIDVTDPEIPPADSPLFRLPNVLLTPHMAGAVGSERARLGRLVADEVERFVAGEPLRHAVDARLLERLA